jgi:AraC-like DNA-binding protein
MRCRSGVVVIHPSQVLVLHRGEIHFSEGLPLPNHLVDFDVVKMDFAFLESARADACQVNFLEPLRAGRLVFKSLVQDSEINARIDELLREASTRNVGFELALKGASLSLLSALVRRHLEATLGAAEAARRTAQQQRLGAVLARLERNFREDFPLSELARLAGLCESHFCRVFRSLTGNSPVEYRNRLRIAAARERLSSSSEPVEQIAFACGFQDPNYFSRIFRKFEGVSPSDCRQMRKTP